MREVKAAGSLMGVLGVAPLLALACSGGTVTVAQNQARISAAADAGPVYDVDAGRPEPGTPTTCAPQRWNCASRQPNCGLKVSESMLPTGCTCEPSRPLSSADCAAHETIACLQVVNLTPGASAAFVRIQCSCLPSAQVQTDFTSCIAALQSLFPVAQSYLDSNYLQPVCAGGPAPICDAGRFCTSSSPEAQPPQGVAYGCEPFGGSPAP